MISLPSTSLLEINVGIADWLLLLAALLPVLIIILQLVMNVKNATEHATIMAVMKDIIEWKKGYEDATELGSPAGLKAWVKRLVDRLRSIEERILKLEEQGRHRVQSTWTHRSSDDGDSG